jgi:dihydroneopterin aldolase
MDHIRIDRLQIDCIVGVRPRERRRRQQIALDVLLGLDASRAGKSGRIVQTVDYSRVADQIGLLLRFREYRLIEMATEELSAMLFGLHPVLETVEIRLEKPAALHGRARSASVEIERTRSQFEAGTSSVTEPWGRREVLLETEEAELNLLHVAAGAHMPPEAEPRRRVEWLTEGRMDRGGAWLAPHAPLVWAHGRRDEYVNRGGETALLFSCSCASASDP